MIGHMKSSSICSLAAARSFLSATCCSTWSRSAWTCETCTATSSWNCSSVASFSASRSSGDRCSPRRGVRWLLAALTSSSSGSTTSGSAASASCSRCSTSHSSSERACTRSSACLTRFSYCRSRMAPAAASRLGLACERLALEACACRLRFRRSVCAMSSSSSAARCSRSKAARRRRRDTTARRSSRCVASKRSFGTSRVVQATSWLATSVNRRAAWRKACSCLLTWRRASQTAARQVVAWAPSASYSSRASDQTSRCCWRSSVVSCWILDSEAWEVRARWVHSSPERSCNWLVKCAEASSRSRAICMHSSSCWHWMASRASTAFLHSPWLLQCSGQLASRASQRAAALFCSRAHSADQEPRALPTRCGTGLAPQEDPQKLGLTSSRAASSQSR
mmetsp:Transcript_25452/g.79309  ORF Transcript_25452/g.79309 Transcript_25452/m.79309 type:complete len:394 (+) Transcript_25452:151-1332(+)